MFDRNRSLRPTQNQAARPARSRPRPASASVHRPPPVTRAHRAPLPPAASLPDVPWVRTLHHQPRRYKWPRREHDWHYGAMWLPLFAPVPRFLHVSGIHYTYPSTPLACLVPGAPALEARFLLRSSGPRRPSLGGRASESTVPPYEANT